MSDRARRRLITCKALLGAASPALSGIEADLAFCHPAVRGMASVDRAAGTVEVFVDDLDAEQAAEVDAFVSIAVERSVQSYRFAEETAPLWRHDAAARHAGGRPALARFIERFTRTTGPGQQILIGPAAQLRRWLDARSCALASELGAEDWHVPNIEMVDDLLGKTGYFTSHPQFVTFGYHLPPHYERVSQFAKTARERLPRSADDLSALQPSGFILVPAVCHNIFRALRSERIPQARVITALGGCYRYEGFRFEPLLRQWDYSVREVVFVGPPGDVEAARRRLITLAQALVAELDIDATLEVATDAFFVSEAGSSRAFQLMGSTKVELKLRIDEGVSTAAASFNRHGHHFSGPMDIRQVDDGDLVDTACAGFGLERWMAAFVARWGAEPSDWPRGIVPG